MRRDENRRRAREREIDARGNTTRSEKYALDEAGTWRLIASVDFEYDAQNRETKRTRGNGRVSSREMMCCGPLWETDEDGVRTDYVYDSAQRLTEETRALTATTPERTRIFWRDAAGRVTRETLKLNSVDFSEKTASWDLLGRLVSETDELGRATSYAYAEDATAPSCSRRERRAAPSKRSSISSRTECGARAASRSFPPGRPSPSCFPAKSRTVSGKRSARERPTRSAE